MADKVLRVCQDSELPPIADMSDSFIYLAYDTLTLYIGDTKYENDFVIADTMPTDPVADMYYILKSDGSVHMFTDYTDTLVADIENQAQIAILNKAGTVFFVNAAKRHLNINDRTLVLPFTIGDGYDLVINIPDDIKINKNTILRYNEDKGYFEIFGESTGITDYSSTLSGVRSDSVSMTVATGNIHGEVVLSGEPDNMLKILDDGLYAAGDSKVNKSDYDDWVRRVENVREYVRAKSDMIEAEINSLRADFDNALLNALETKYDQFDTALAKYDDLYRRLRELEDNSSTT